jgi:endonuclease/exonuclease/phosphatase (EEP) superfamily protein YafD
MEDRALTKAFESTGARRYWLLWATVIPLALWALLRALGLEDGDRLTSLMWFVPYAAVAAALVAGIAISWRNWAAAAVAAIAALYLASTVLPRAIGNEAVPVDGRETLSVLSANVYLGGANPTSLVSLVDRYRPDVLSVQELTPSFARKLGQAGIARRLPHSTLMPQPRGRGGGLYARHPLTLLPHQTFLPTRMPRAMLDLPDGERVRIVAVHPFPPNMGAEIWKEVLENLPVPGNGIPWVLAGDFNATLDQAEFRDLIDRGYRDAADVTGKGLEPTWPGPDEFPWGLIAIDHVLADRRLGIADYGVDDLAGSDHRVIHAQLVLP